MIAVQLEQISNTSNLAGQYIRLHVDYLLNQMTGSQRRVDRQNAPEEEEAFQLLAGRSYAPMHRLSLLSVGHPYS
jgi:hypothetical protein